jgi:pimeloyl-ACP methyl ester carboxylesterase
MSSRIPKVHLAIIEDCGHMSTMERPQAVTAFPRKDLKLHCQP